jgi:hypothetical protein
LPIVQAIVVDTRRDSNSKRNVKFKSFYWERLSMAIRYLNGQQN